MPVIPITARTRTGWLALSRRAFYPLALRCWRLVAGELLLLEKFIGSREHTIEIIGLNVQSTALEFEQDETRVSIAPRASKTSIRVPELVPAVIGR